MRRHLSRFVLLFGLWTATAWGAGQFLPTTNIPANTTIQTWATATRCVEFVPSRSSTGLTSLAWAPGSQTGTCDVGLYPAGGGTAIRRASEGGAVDCDGTPTVATMSGLSSFSVTAGTEYRLCWCGQNAVGNYTAINTTGAGGPNGILNAFVTNVGTDATNTCTSGVLPSGAASSLTPSTTFHLLLVWTE